MAASTALAAVVIPLLVVPGATLLLERVQEHSQTYEEAREATSLIYERAAVAADAGATAAGPYATGACDFVRAVPASVTARCDAFAAVTTYNEILVKLAAGDPAVRSELGQLSVALGGLHAFLEQDTTVQTLLASAGPAVGPLLGIIDQAQKLTSAAACGRSFERGRPAVQAILQTLRDDVPRLYDLEEAYMVAQLREFTFAIADVHGAAADIVDQHALPTGQPESGDRSAIVGRFDALLDDLELPGLAKDDRLSRQSPGAAPHTAATTLALRAQLDRLEPAAEHFRDAAKPFLEYRKALSVYGKNADRARQLARESFDNGR